MRATVCLPTYNERENLEPMLRALARVLREGDRVLVIDDNSPDGTGERADELAAELDFVDVLHRPHKEGLGPAYLAGFRRRARGRRGAGARDGLRLLARPRRRAAADRGGGRRRRPRARLTLRAGRTGRATGGFSGGRSRAAASLYTRALPADGRPGPDRRLQVLPPRACSRRSISTRSPPRGYAFQIETTYRAMQAGFRVVEVPITFVDRAAGSRR